MLDEEVYKRIKVLSNEKRFKILQLVSEREYTITELSSKLELTYNKSRDYVTIMHSLGLVTKVKKGRNVLVSTKVKIVIS